MLAPRRSPLARRRGRNAHPRPHLSAGLRRARASCGHLPTAAPRCRFASSSNRYLTSGPLLELRVVGLLPAAHALSNDAIRISSSATEALRRRRRCWRVLVHGVAAFGAGGPPQKAPNAQQGGGAGEKQERQGEAPHEAQDYLQRSWQGRGDDPDQRQARHGAADVEGKEDPRLHAARPREQAYHGTGLEDHREAREASKGRTRLLQPARRPGKSLLQPPETGVAVVPADEKEDRVFGEAPERADDEPKQRCRPWHREAQVQIVGIQRQQCQRPALHPRGT
mmetsp:Transcript_11118/g.31021  ORF Transcript_11118/g.31021 Transcript_11118/m.31021 type:complete len:281 (+) Transcript_11118:83-925(+)